MKKIFSMALVAIVAATMVSCGNDKPKVKLNNGLDSLSYAYGVSYTRGLDSYLDQIGPIDSIYMSQFYKGVSEAFNANGDANRKAYYIGLQIGTQLNDMLARTNQDLTSKDSVEYLKREDFLAGFLNAASKGKTNLTPEEVDSLVNKIGQMIANDNHRKMTEEKRKVSDEFIAKKKKEAGVMELPKGVLYKVITEGDGPVPTANATVKVFYEGKLIDGTVFDSSSKHGDTPVQFRANQVIQGWTEALTNMPKGSKWELYIPQELAYGERGAGQMIPPFAPLIFTVELVDFEEPETKEAK